MENESGTAIGFICGVKPNHEHNDDWVFVETFGGGIYKGPAEAVYPAIKAKGERAQTESVCCSICGSSAFGRDVYYGME